MTIYEDKHLSERVRAIQEKHRRGFAAALKGIKEAKKRLEEFQIAVTRLAKRLDKKSDSG